MGVLVVIHYSSLGSTAFNGIYRLIIEIKYILVSEQTLGTLMGRRIFLSFSVLVSQGELKKGSYPKEKGCAQSEKKTLTKHFWILEAKKNISKEKFYEYLWIFFSFFQFLGSSCSVGKNPFGPEKVLPRSDLSFPFSPN